MELLFLNEDSVSAGNSVLSEIRAYAKENNITLFDEDTTLDEALLECAEGLNEAEVTAMREEFAMYQESVLNEGVMGDAWDKLKEWWAKIKEWITKAVEKVVHWFWVAVTWCRKQIQVAINKVHGSTTVYVPKSLMKTSKFSDDVVAQLVTPLKAIIDKDSDDLSEIDKDEKKEIKGRLATEFKRIKAGVANDKGNGEYEAVPLNAWKTMMDNALKNFENAKNVLDKLNKAIANKIKEADKAFADGYKAGKDANNATLRKNCMKLKRKAFVTAKRSSFIIKVLRWRMSALFSCASYKKRDKKENYENKTVENWKKED